MNWFSSRWWDAWWLARWFRPMQPPIRLCLRGDISPIQLSANIAGILRIRGDVSPIVLRGSTPDCHQ